MKVSVVAKKYGMQARNRSEDFYKFKPEPGPDSYNSALMCFSQRAIVLGYVFIAVSKIFNRHVNKA